ncbi:MAG: MlaD family protein [Rhizomicrobium sp.]|jgi:phospholipid/cholesterol/gamma-HCH transport system substrate-binding protein
METKANYVAVGAFVLACVLGAVVALLWLAGAQYSEEYVYYKTDFEGPVTGLGNGTAVRFNGIDVGHISKLNFDPDDPKKVIVTLQVDPALQLHADSVATIASEGLTGGSYVEIDGGSKTAPILKPKFWGDYPTLKSKQSTLQELEQSLPQLMAKINKIGDRLNLVLSDQNLQSIAGTLSNLRDVTGALNRHSGDIERILTNVSSASGSLNTDLGDLHSVLSDADGTVHRLDRLSDDADAAVNGAQLTQLVAQMRGLVKSVTHLSDQLENEPTQLIFGDRRKGYTPQ